MIAENKICPYPGLRPFNEEESIFFKGRDEHITQIVHQLEKKKFLMITGASGDGKSSLVYAGVIPQARAGFFKAKFNNWVVADFRPERTPLQNLASSLSNALNLHDKAHTEKELSYGFSALVDLYQSSSFWLDQGAPEFIGLDDTEKKKRKRKGANLLILVDQFEEFFTNAENYAHGKPSFESQAVINVLLETAKIALDKDIPIYIVCTMRSDYIGQCASFRNLPEYIGFSQFFVPRLNRQEIYQVIEEPALLNGDKISKRLVETFISQLDEGVDQLPVLQHALNQVWQTANDGSEEMDLLHLAKIGGLNKKYLNPADRKKFEEWLALLPGYKKPFYENPSLDNVLDTHAKELFEVAGKDANSKHNEQLISDADAKKLIETSFKCLTKIDEGRAVRNRMTLQEITNIINNSAISTKVVGEILDVYRRQGNTFLKPFITEDADTEMLKPASILDITHESLIRNWTILGQWTKEEYDDLQNFQDFNKQLQRWVKHKKSSDYLLPIGPLTFFENWFNKARPNQYWLEKYDERDISREQKLLDAEETLRNSHEFLRRSARRLIVSRTVLKYGADKIIAGFGLLVLIVSCTYFAFDFRKKQNDYVIEHLQKRSIELLKSKYIKSSVKSDYILTEERMNPGCYKKLLNTIQSDSSQLDVLRNMLITCIVCQQGKKDIEPDNPLLGSLFLHQIELINKSNPFLTDSNFYKNINNVLCIVYEHILIKRSDYKLNIKAIDSSFDNFCSNSYNAGIVMLSDTGRLRKIEIKQFNKLLQTMPELANYDKEKLEKVINAITPFNDKSQKTFNILYPKDKIVKRNYTENITHNSGYFQLCNLYALCGDFDHLNKSFDSILFYNKNFLNDNSGYSYTDLLYDLIICKKLLTKEGLSFVDKIKAKLIISERFPILVLLQDGLLGPNKAEIKTYNINYIYNPRSEGNDFDVFSIERVTRESTCDLIKFNIQQELNNNTVSSDEKNYMVALFYKALAFFNNNRNQSTIGDTHDVRENLIDAFAYYSKISANYLDDNMSIGEGTDNKIIRRSEFFKYPFYLSLVKTWNIYSYYDFQYYKGDAGTFINAANSVSDTFFSHKDMEVLNKFMFNYSYTILNEIDAGKRNVPYNINSFISVLKVNSDKIDKDMVNAFLVLYYNKLKDEGEAKKYLHSINFNNLFKKEKIFDNETAYPYITLAYRMVAYLAHIQSQEDKSEQKLNKNERTKCLDVVDILPLEYLKRNAFLVAIDSLGEKSTDKFATSLTDTLLNSYVSKIPSFGNMLFEILGRYNTIATNKIAINLMKDKNDKMKPECLNLFIKGLAESNNYYSAYTHIPEYMSSSSQLSLYNTILKVKLNNKENVDGWSALDGNSYNWLTGALESSDNGSVYITQE